MTARLEGPYSWEMVIPPRGTSGYRAARLKQFQLAEREALFAATNVFFKWMPAMVRFHRWIFLNGHPITVRDILDRGR